MKTKDTFFCEKSFIDRSFLVLEILSGGNVVLLAQWLNKLNKPKIPMVNRIKT